MRCKDKPESGSLCAGRFIDRDLNVEALWNKSIPMFNVEVAGAS